MKMHLHVKTEVQKLEHQQNRQTDRTQTHNTHKDATERNISAAFATSDNLTDYHCSPSYMELIEEHFQMIRNVARCALRRRFLHDSRVSWFDNSYTERCVGVGVVLSRDCSSCATNSSRHELNATKIRRLRAQTSRCLYFLLVNTIAFQSKTDYLRVYIKLRSYDLDLDRMTLIETRNKADLYLHSVNTIFGQRCIKFKGALLWNELPDYIKNIRSINKFKSKLKSYLQQNYILE